MNYIRPQRSLAGEKAPDGHSPGRTIRSPDSAEFLSRMASQKPSGKATAWTKSMIGSIAFAESRSARIIGITGIRDGVGASLIAREFAQIYSEFDKRILFVSASRPNLSDKVAATVENVPDLAALSVGETANLAKVDLSNPDLPLPPLAEFFKYTFETALHSFHAVVVDLPTAAGIAGRPTPAFLSLSAACNSVLLVCLTGRTTRAEVLQCLASCKISGTNVEGILLNDFRLPGSRLLAEI